MIPKQAAQPINGAQPALGTFIEPHEIEEAKSIVEQQCILAAGRVAAVPRPAGYYVLVKTYLRPEEIKVIKRDDGTEARLILPSVSMDRDKYESNCALVVSMGAQAYKGVTAIGTPRYPEGQWCNVGDWVMVPRFGEGFSFMWCKNVVFQLIPDDRILAVIQEPADISGLPSVDRI